MAVQPYKNPLKGFKVPFFMVDLGNFEVITMTTVPLSVQSSKPINWAKTAIPGMSFEAMQFSNFGAQELSFQIKLISRNPQVGNLPVLKQFENLRTPTEGLASLMFKSANNANPQVLFWYGSGNSMPLIYYVTKIDFNNILFNKMGYPTVTDISVSLSLDEDSILYQSEKVARMVLSLTGMAEGIFKVVQSFRKVKPY